MNPNLPVDRQDVADHEEEVNEPDEDTSREAWEETNL